MTVVGGRVASRFLGLPPLDFDRRAPGAMIIGVPKEVKQDEYRVAITPAGVRELTSAGHTVYVERNGGSVRRSPMPSSWPPAPRSSLSPPTSGPSPTWSSG